MATPPTYPRINGAVPDFATISLNVSSFGLSAASPGSGVVGIVPNRNIPQPPPGIIDIRAIDFDSKNNAKWKTLTGPYPAGRVAGQVSAAASIDWGCEAVRYFLMYLRNTSAGGSSDMRFSVDVAYSLTPAGVLFTDTLPDARIVGIRQAHSSNGNELLVKIDLSIPDVLVGLPDQTQISMANVPGSVQGF